MGDTTDWKWGTLHGGHKQSPVTKGPGEGGS